MDLRVVAGVIVRGREVLVARRGAGRTAAGLWEFPGGKVEPGESDVDALVRELREELGIDVAVGPPIATSTTPLHAGSLTIQFLSATIERGAPAAVEHSEIRWVTADALEGLEWVPADRPALPAVRSLLSR